MRIAVVNGPNLNLLGTREREIYGSQSLGAIETAVRSMSAQRGFELDWHQTNDEGQFVDIVQGFTGRVRGAAINAAAFTHTSLAIRDALLAVRTPFVEVHLSNVFGREAERRRSLLADIAVGVVAGFGPASYLLGIEGLLGYLEHHSG